MWGCRFVCLLLLPILGPGSSWGQAQEKPETIPAVMRQKLAHAQGVLEGITVSNFDKVKADATALLRLTRHDDWAVYRGPEYDVHTEEFRRTARDLTDAAEKKNADAAAIAYVRMTLTCVRCHRHVRPESESVKPGINESFLDPKLDVEEYKNRFEVESREVYAQRKEIVNALGLKKGMAVADIGAGTGLFLEPFARSVGEDGKVYAVDISPRFIDHLQNRVRDEKFTQARVVLGEQDSVELPRNSVDMVFVCDTYHHFEYPQSTLASIHRALKPGGRLVVIDFERIPGKTREWLLNHVRANKETFRKEIEEAGFQFVEEKDIKGLVENYFLVFTKPQTD